MKPKSKKFSILMAFYYWNSKWGIKTTQSAVDSTSVADLQKIKCH